MQACPRAARASRGVFHEADPFGDEHLRMWLIYAPVSGIWFDLGKTIAFADHVQTSMLRAHFGVPANVDQNEAMSNVN